MLGLCLSIAISSGVCQSTEGSVSGLLRLPTGLNTPLVSDSMDIVLRELSSSQPLQTQHPKSDGHFEFYNVPFANYRLEAWKGQEILASHDLTVNSSLPLKVDLQISEAGRTEIMKLPDRMVKSENARLDPWNHSFYSSEAIHDLMVQSREKTAEALLLQSADVVPDEDGRMHVRGEDAQILYVVDGIPMGGNPTRVYSSLFGTGVAKSVDVRGGGLPAQYAAGSAVVAVTTQDGLEEPFAVRVGSGAASFGTREAEVQASGRVAGNNSLLVGVSHSATDRYLDPIDGFGPLHSGGQGSHVFGKITSVQSENVELRMLGAYDATDYQIPNLQKSPNTALPSTQDQAQKLDAYLAGVRLDIELGDNAHFGLAGYSRRTAARLTSGGLDRIASAQDSQKAVSENDKFFIGAQRQEGYHGGLIEFSSQQEWAGHTHRFLLGASGEVNPLKESLALAVTNDSIAGPGGDTALRPYDLTRGGNQLEADESRQGWIVSAYAQDAFDVGKWTFVPGLRIDAFHLFETEWAISPRFAAAYALHPKVDLRGSLDYLVTRAPLENILLSSSASMRPISSEQGATPTRVGAERAIALDLGATYRPFPVLDVDVDGYGKYIRNFLVKAELSNSGLIFPLNLKEGLVAGGQVRAKLREWHRLSGMLSIGSCASIGLKPEDGSSPVAAGLLVGEEGHNYSHPWQGEDIFPTEHNQIATAVLNLRYRLARGLHASMAGRFDSGLPFDLTDASGNGLDPAAARTELQNRGYTNDVIDLLNLESEEPGSPDKSVAPHAVFDLGMDYRRPVSRRLAFEVRAAVLNVLDTPYLYKFESSFGSTHYGQPRTFGVWAAVDY